MKKRQKATDPGKRKQLLRTVPTQFANVDEYADIFGALIEEEKKADRRMNSAKEPAKVTWKEPACSRYEARLVFQNLNALKKLALKKGELVVLKAEDQEGQPWYAEGVVSEIQEPSKIYVDIEKEIDILPKYVLVERHHSAVTYDRAMKTIQRFRQEDSPNKSMKDVILGRSRLKSTDDLPLDEGRKAMLKKLKIKHLLNDSQAEAIKLAMTSPISLVRSGPGCGKSYTAAFLVKCMMEKKGTRILVTASTNAGADALTRSIVDKGIDDIVRVYAKSFQKTDMMVGKFSIEAMLKYALEYSKIDDLENRKELTKEEKEELHDLKKTATVRIIRNKSVVAVTPYLAASRDLLDRGPYDLIIIDESAQLTEPFSLMAISGGSKRVCLLADPLQLRPNVSSQRAAKARLNVSLFERLLNLGLPSAYLNIQYRAIPRLISFINTYWYEDKLQHGVKNSDRLLECPRIWSREGKRVIYEDTQGEEEHEEGYRSFFNEKEVDKILNWTCQLLNNNFKVSDILILTPYVAQVESIKERLANHLIVGARVLSIDACQGLEAEVVLLSLVRSRGLGFVNNTHRCNVALTRARNALCITGRQENMIKDGFWKKYLTYYGYM